MRDRDATDPHFVPPESGTRSIRVDAFFREAEDDVAARSRTVVATRHAADYLRRGAMYERQGMLEKAAFLYRQAAGCEVVAARALHRCGQLERQVGHPQTAVATLKAALHHAVHDPALTVQLYVELGDVYAQLGDPEEAAYYFRRAVRQAPDRDDVLVRLELTMAQVRRLESVRRASTSMRRAG